MSKQANFDGLDVELYRGLDGKLVTDGALVEK